ncbi:hypothetical protein PMZ80_005862 [Knufia obscura]|uniref:Uncharacterized protein n=2 Tax=Knufia TaxID=430999 RepID=A0AAN8I6G2_9EURO|nr:hypothetical protein PMZ80_005862 [Knufia obscura]KAK5954529.1 hypothetical protein OHC33_004251 [Knufia fluminis]
MENHHFKLDRNPQDNSLLLKLPTELRVKVLRNLHVRHHPIKIDWETSDDHKDIPKVDSFPLELSSQVLRTCQQLYIESHDTLYKYNTLDIVVKPSGSGRTAILILNRRASFFSNMTLNNLSGIQPFEELAAAAKERLKAEPMINYSVLARFHQFRLEIRYRWAETIFKTCRILKDLLYDKDVRLALVGHHREYNIKDVAGLRHFQCRSMAIIQPELYTTLSASDIAEIEHNALATTPTTDTFMIWRQLKDNIIDTLHEIDGSAFMESRAGKSAAAKLEDVSKTYDVVEFDRCKNAFLKVAQDWNSAWARWQVAETQRIEQAMEREILRHL